MSTDKERMEIVLAHLRMNPSELAKSLGYTRTQRIYFVLNERNGISESLARDINTIYPYISYQWLKNGTGDMLVDITPTDKTEDIRSTDEYRLLQNKFNALLNDYKELKKEAEPLNPNAVIYVPLVNQYAYAGYLNGYQNDTYMDTLPTIPFIADHEARGNYIAFEVKGDSMNDGTEESYLEGDRLLCREVQPHLWVDSKLHIRKWDFVIVHEDGILVKRIIDHDVKNHTITVHSLNDMYPDRVIDLAEVKQIFNVVEMQRPRRR